MEVLERVKENDTLMLFKDEDYEAKDVNGNALVRQDNRIINGRWKMNVNQTRIFLTAISMIDSTDKEFETYRIKGVDLKAALELKGNSLYRQLEKDMPKLMRTVIEIETEEEEGKEWISLMSTAKYSNGDLYLKFNEAMKPYLLNLREKFTQFKLQDALKFKSSYTLRLFLLLKQFDSAGWRYMPIDELRNDLNLNKNEDQGIKKDLYPLTADFKKRVLNPSVKELNENGFKVGIQQIKEGKKIIAFKFKWSGINSVEKVEITVEDDVEKRLAYRLIGVGLNDRQVKYIMGLIGNGLTKKDMNGTIWSIEKAIREKKIPPEKMGGYAYSTFKNKFGITGL
jgi:plasmid replication initiation protein